MYTCTCTSIWINYKNVGFWLHIAASVVLVLPCAFCAGPGFDLRPCISILRMYLFVLRLLQFCSFFFFYFLYFFVLHNVIFFGHCGGLYFNNVTVNVFLLYIEFSFIETVYVKCFFHRESGNLGVLFYTMSNFDVNLFTLDQ